MQRKIWWACREMHQIHDLRMHMILLKNIINAHKQKKIIIKLLTSFKVSFDDVNWIMLCSNRYI